MGQRFRRGLLVPGINLFHKVQPQTAVGVLKDPSDGICLTQSSTESKLNTTHSCQDQGHGSCVPTQTFGMLSFSLKLNVGEWHILFSITFLLIERSKACLHKKCCNFILGRNGRSEADRRQPDYKLKLKQNSLFSFH